MSDPVQVLGKRLDDITMKLDAMADGITALLNAIQKTNEGLGENVKKLTEIIGKYTDSMTERLKNDFEQSRGNITAVNQAIGQLTKVTGADQIMRIDQGLRGVLQLLQQSIDPNRIQTQLAEISQFIKMYGGQK